MKYWLGFSITLTVAIWSNSKGFATDGWKCVLSFGNDIISERYPVAIIRLQMEFNFYLLDQIWCDVVEIFKFC